LKSTKQFTDYDFAGSNLSVILNTLAYQAQLNSYTANLVANESFLYTSTIRKNVVANARSIGYVPHSARSAISTTDFIFQLDVEDYPSGLPQSILIRPGIIFSTNGGNGNFTSNILEPQVASVSNSGLVEFKDVVVYEGTKIDSKFVVDTADYNQKFILMNNNVDTTTIRVEVQENPNEEVTSFYRQADNLVELTKEDRIYWLEEIDRGYYELTFGDDLFGKELKNGAVINVSYIVTNGEEGNGIQFEENFNYVGQSVDSNGVAVLTRPTVLSVSKTEGGARVEDVSSIKYRAPRQWAAQNRCVTSEDYDVLCRKVFPAVEDIYVYGGETLSIPEYGRVYVTIKPTTGDTLSNLTKSYIKKSLNPYRVASLDIVIKDPDILYVEVDSLVYFDEKRTLKDVESISATVRDTLNRYVLSTAVPKFGGALSYSKLVCVIDESEKSITRNDTGLIMRKNLKILPSNFATYEVCVDQPVKVDKDQSAVYSSGFKLEVDNKLDERVFYFENDCETIRFNNEEEERLISDIYAFYIDEFGTKIKVNFYETDTNILKIVNVPFEDKNITPFGTLYFDNGEVELGLNYKRGIKIIETEEPSNVVEIRMIPKDKDIIANESVFLKVDVAKSDIRSIIDTQLAGS